MRTEHDSRSLRPPAFGHAGVLALLDAFRGADVPYCHFKSNEHVAEGIRGETDLDILIDRAAHDKAQALLVGAGFKLFPSEPLAGYPAVEDWIGFDPHTGKLAHLHVHWQMIAGEPHLKGYRIPWERRILEGRIWRADLGIFTASVEMELLLLLTRAALKFRSRSYVRTLRGRPAYGADLNRERVWLVERVDHAGFAELVHSMLPAPLAEEVIDVAIGKDLDSRGFERARRAVVRHLSPWRSFSSLHARLYRWKREAWRRVGVRILRQAGKLPLCRRTSATGGLIVSLIGADGSGKSTQTKALLRWLGWKIDVARIYFGSGDGPTSWHRAALLWLQSRLGRAGRRKAVSSVDGVPVNSPAFPAALPGTLQRAFRGLYAISLAFEKRSAIRKATRARNRGMIVICDRYPQNQIAGYNDGPLLAEWIGAGAPWSNLARLEGRLLAVFSVVSPDMVIKLNVSEEVAAVRKADTPKEMIGKKIAAVRNLGFGPECEIVEVDADRPLEEVTLAVRANVWKLL